MFGNYGFYYLLLVCSLQQSMARQQHFLNWVSPDDPDKHIQGVTYEKLHEVFQSYPVDRINMEGDGFISEITKNCKDLVDEREKRHVDTVVLHGERQVFVEKKKVCSSVLLNCQKMEKPTVFCQSDDPERRYDYAQPIYKRDVIYGRKNRDSCTLERYFMGSLVNPCLCECESAVQAVDRYFSLRNVVADDDKVVTGIRIKKDNHVFHIQIQQGTLGPNLTIVGEAKWKPIEKISTDDLLSEKISKYRRVRGWERELEFFKNDLVYAITAKQNTILLDILKAEPGHVVTGLRFRQIDNDLRLEIRTTPYFTKSADLQPLASRWIEPEAIDKSQRKAIKMKKAGIPSEHNELTAFPTWRDSNRYYVQFQTSDFQEDVGQTTVPFIDIQDVVPHSFANPPLPLLGAAIDHRGNSQSAGFIALRGAYDDIINY